MREIWEGGGAKLRPRGRRRALAIALGLVVAVVLLEAILQVASFVAWSRTAHIDRPEGRVLLCIGDSLTFGLGAKPDEAYPPRLQDHLAKRGSRWSVVNAGIPGQNSADVATRLADLLPTLRPAAVCLLVGWNDTWARPAPVDPVHFGENGFPLRWRTGRLLSLLFASADAIAENQHVPFLGAWHVKEHEFYFAADGTARLGALAATWTVDGEVLQITPAGGKTFALRWRQAERGIEFAMFGWDRFQRARRGPAVQAAEGEAIEDMLHRSELDAAVSTFAAMAESARSLALRAAICEALFDAGRTGEADALFKPLRVAWEQNHDPVAGEAVARRLCRGGGIPQQRLRSCAACCRDAAIVCPAGACSSTPVHANSAKHSPRSWPRRRRRRIHLGVAPSSRSSRPWPSVRSTRSRRSACW